MIAGIACVFVATLGVIGMIFLTIVTSVVRRMAGGSYGPGAPPPGVGWGFHDPYHRRHHRPHHHGMSHHGGVHHVKPAGFGGFGGGASHKPHKPSFGGGHKPSFGHGAKKKW